MSFFISKNVESFNKKLADKIETRTQKRTSATEGSFKNGGPVCKLATKGKGRAYGKNS